MLNQSQIIRVLKQLRSTISSDVTGLTEVLNKFLQVQQDYLITFMNNQIFRGDDNLLIFLKNSLEEGLPSEEEARKMVYTFVADYIETYRNYLGDYLKGLFSSFYIFFKRETGSRAKQKSLSPIRQILLNYTQNDLNGVIDPNPSDFHNQLTEMLKIDKLTSSVRGQLWNILGILQNKFALSISYTKKNELKNLVNSDKNLSTIASILRSFTYSLNQNHLDDRQLQQLFNYTKAIMIPLKATFDASTAALQLITAQSTLFHQFIMKNALSIFKTLSGLMGHQNKNYKFAVLDTLAVVVKQIVIGINEDIESHQNKQLFNFIGNTMWLRLQQQTKFDQYKPQQKNRYAGSVISIVKILGTLSPLILTINGMNDLKRFFAKLLTICNRKVIRAFQQMDNSSGATKKIHVMKIILYNQKQLVSFIFSFARILQQLDTIQYKQALNLQQLFLVGVRQYPFYLQKYIPQLIQSMVQFLMALSTKPQIFNSWCKKIILISLMQSLDAKRFNINTDKDYYLMIKKSAKMWSLLLTHTLWSGIVAKQFSKILFDSLQHLFLNLDISYKTNIELQIQSEEKEQPRLKQQQMELVNVFFLADQNIQMSNISDYQYVSSLSLIFNQLMLTIDQSLYYQRVYGFYQQIIYRLKIFPKSIPLMKVVRSLNAYIMRTNWFMDNQKQQANKKSKQLISLLKNFFKFVCDNIFKYQQNYFYQALKMLISMPLNVFLQEQCDILKNDLPGIVTKSLQLGQQIISLAYQTVNCLNNLFKNAKKQSVSYLSSCIPYLQKYINFNKNAQSSLVPQQQKQQVRSYLFLYECNIRRQQISSNVMKFLGSIGGFSHMMVQNTTKDYISWDYYCKLDLTVYMKGDTLNINLTKLLARTCWLMLHGSQAQKIVSSQFMHAIMIYVIGRAASKANTMIQQTKQNLSNFFDRVLPTLLSVGSNPSHPSQQLIHTLIIQTIHFLANTQDSNSPDIQTLLKHLISLYTGAEDMSFLASKCLSQLVKWHIKQAPNLPQYSYPLIKTVLRNVWSLASNKKARNGLIQFLIKFLKAIHRQFKLMTMYAIELCSLIISLGRTDKHIQPLLDYLIKKYVLAISPYIKPLIIQEGSRRFKKLSTIQKLLLWIYNNALFSVYRQQRTIAYMFWQAILSKYGHFFNTNMQQNQGSHNIQVFLSEQCSRELKYLFGQSRPLSINQDQPKLEKVLPKISAYGQIWIKIVKNNIFQPNKLTRFKDLQQVYLQSFCSFIDYFTQHFINLQSNARIISYQSQKAIIDCILTFIELYLSLGDSSTFMIDFMIKKVPVFQRRRNVKNITFIQLLLKLLLKPNGVIPNFNYDIIYQCYELQYQNVQSHKQTQLARKQQQQNFYFNKICKFLQQILANNLFPVLFNYIKIEFKKQDIQELIPYIIYQPSFYDRQIKCVLSTMAILANSIGKGNKTFLQILKSALELAVFQYEQKSKHNLGQLRQNQKQISGQKKSLLIWYILQHAQNYSIVKDFLVRVIKQDTVIYQKHEKAIMKSIINNWNGVKQKIVDLAYNNNQFLSLIFILCKMLNGHKLQGLYELIQTYLIGIGVNKQDRHKMMGQNEANKDGDNKKSNAISEMLKISFYVVQDKGHSNMISKQYKQYIHRLVCVGMDIKYSIDIHEQSLNLGGVIIRQHSILDDDKQYEQFIGKYRQCLFALTNYYIPLKISKIATSQLRNKCANYLKIFKSMIILSNNIRYLQFIFSLLKDQQLQGYYYNLLQQIIYECLTHCYQNSSNQQQIDDLQWMIKIYKEQGMDNDCWRNIRAVIVDQILIKAIKLTKQDVLIQFFQKQVPELIKSFTSETIPMALGDVKKLIMAIQLKRATFQILQELYSNLPRKQKNTQQIYKVDHHKNIIKYCLQYCKQKFNEQAELMLKQYDQKKAQQQKQKLVITKTQKLQGKKPTCIEYLRRLCCSAYNCLIVIFISTQSNKAHFQSYLFQSKGILWKNIMDENKLQFQFEIQTNFSQMKPVTKINKKLNKKIKDKYWSNSLYAIQEQYVPSSLVQNMPVITELVNQDKPQNPQYRPQAQPQNIVQLDPINKHPCMINLLRVIDFMHEKFFDGTLPGWMKPIHQQLASDTCPLSVRILLTKLIINRRLIFTQNIWADVLIKYLTLKDNGGKFVHYFYRDAVKQLLQFIKNGYIPQNITDINTILMKVIRALPHQQKMIYSDNIDIMQALLKIPGVSVSKSTIINMLKTNQKKKQGQQQVKLKYQWRMCAVIVLKSCLALGVPVLDQNQIISKNADKTTKYKFYFDMRKQGYLNLILEMAFQLVKKYRIAAAGFLGQLLHFVTQSQVQKMQQQQLVKLVAKYLANINMQQSNRNSKQKFSICILHVCTRFPQILNNQKLYNQIQYSVSTYRKQERVQILQTILLYCQHLNKINVLGYIPQIFVTLRSIMATLLTDIHQVQMSLLSILRECCKQQILINKQVIDTYFYVYDDLQRVFANSVHVNDCIAYYRILISLKDFTSDPDLPKTNQIRQLNQKVNKGLLQGLGSRHQEVKQLIFNQFQNQSKQYEDSASRMLDIIVKLYDPQHQDLWLINVVPLLLSSIKQSSDYTRLRFQQTLGDLTAFYDWDFRKNMKLHNNSQPYTPAFTLATGANNLYRRIGGTIQQSFNPSIGGDKLKGMIKASQNFYMSQQQQVFTILASQSEYQPSFDASLNSQRESPMSSYGQGSLSQGQQTTNSMTNKIKQIFKSGSRKRNRIMQDFNQSNMKRYPSSIKIVDNKVRFNKNYDKSVSKPGQYSPSFNSSQQEGQGQLKIGTKGVLIRKYKVGELPDIQITTKDLVDPMLFLANRDHQFAGQLFILVFMKLCLYARKQKKDAFKQVICKLLKSSRKCQYNFISTLQKSLICLCHNQKQKIDFSMKEIGMKSNTLDYAIVFTEQNQIQTIKQPDFQQEQQWRKKVNDIWGDLVDLYQQINQQDWIYGVLIRLAEGDERKLILQALNLKKLGSIKKSQEALNVALQQSNNKRIKQFIHKQKIDCNTILGAWQPVVLELNKKVQSSTLEINQQKILTVALQNTRIQEKADIFKKMNFHQTKCQYQKAVLYILCEKDYDMGYHHLQKSISYFSNQWQKISSFAFNSKHLLLQEVQKKYQLQQFLQLYRKDEIKRNQYQQLFSKWSDRQPNSIYDSNLTFLQILQSRIMFSQLLSNKFSIDQKIIIRSTIDWLIQTSNGMIQKGVLGGAETLIKKALACKRKQNQLFIWDFYDSVAKLKLKQLMVQKSINFNDYEIVSNLIKKQMNSSKIPITELQKLKLISLKNDFFEGYLASCLSSQQPIVAANFVNKVQTIFGNYGELRKSVKQNIFGSSTLKQFEQYKRDMYFKFTVFLQKILSYVNQKTNFPLIKQSMVQKNYTPQRLAHIFVQTLFTSIQISDFTNNLRNFQQNMLFSLIMKLLKIIQSYSVQVGQYFAQAVNNKRVPTWIFLYFIPQMIKFINNPNLVGYFQDLFRNIASMYPQALIYHFNCSYQQDKDRATPFCNQLAKYLRQKMDVNYKFIDSLVLLQYPEIRLRQSLNKFVNIACQRQNAIIQLKQLIKDTQYLGKYNKKFVQDWAPKITKVLNKIQSNDLSVFNDIKIILSYIDPSKKQNLKTVAARMKDFVKVSDGSLFFEEYNSNDWNRIQIPSTSYRKFEQPKPWKKLFIQSFDHSLLTLLSKQRPRRITIYGSNQKKYMLLIKAGQDVRLDQRIQKLFEIMNRILKGHSQSSKKQLQIRRFQVTPIRKMMGIFEWVDESQTLKQFLETQFKIIKQTDKVNFKDGNKAFEFRMQFLNRIAPMTQQIKDPNHQHKALLNANKADVVKCFIECQKQIPYGLLRRALERLSKNYDSFLHIKNGFIANYALVCCVTYILGIGDRHLQNFLIHMGSASVVPIDFGYSFGASLQLGVPQLMPFRLTKCFQQLMQPVGFQGVFKKSMISSFQAFSQNVALISDYCQVFVDDPLLQWVWTNKKNVSQASMNKNSQFSSSQDPPEKALFTQKIGSVRKKLQGINPRLLFDNMLSNSRHKHASYAKTLSDAILGRNTNRVQKLSTSDLVDELISLATDKNILGRTYIGWNPYV